MIWLKNIVFWVVFVVMTLIFFVFFILGAPLPPRVRHHTGVAWARSFLWLLKHIIGLDYRVEGTENIPSQPSIICCKHQSGYETLALQKIFPHQVFVLKRELFYIPVVGQGLMLMSPIAIDRQDRVKATRQILEQGTKRKRQGFWITIFPEGTRTKPGMRGRYKQGSARMAQTLQMDMVPVAVNSGEFWPRNAFLKYPGTITFVVLPPIPWNAGSVEELTKQCEEAIETAQRRIEGQGPFAAKGDAA
ncbi:MAG: lysophospholipid acyltransferase family protein [Neisseria sp.]|nr:lysophospholipid acyltransferase family protein [Neisseria sp.]